MTWQDLLDRIRDGLNDPSKIRWTDPSLLQRVNMTRDEMWADHKEAFAVSTVVTAIPTAPTELTLTSDIDFLPDWVMAVRAHVLWQVYMDDIDERQNVTLADKHFAVWAKKALV
jgi:hypothetical protein